MANIAAAALDQVLRESAALTLTIAGVEIYGKVGKLRIEQ